MDRVVYTLQQDGVDEKIIDSALQHTRLYFDVVKGNSEWDKLKRSVDLYKTKDWATDVLKLPVIDNDEDMMWWRSHNYDPAYELSRIKCRVLSIMAENDNLVPPSENKPLMEKYLTKAGVAHKIIILPDAGHNGISFQTLYGGEWKWPENFWIWPKRPVIYYEEIIKWIKGK